MNRAMLCVCFLTASSSATAATTPPNGTTVAGLSNVIWTDAIWKSDGTGAMPIGNGDMTSSVWVDEDTGDLRLLISKSDVFDENSQPVKTGVLRLAFNPPLWTGTRSGPSPPPITKCPAGAAFCQTLDLATATVHITTPTISVAVSIDLNAPNRGGVPHRDAGILHVTAKGTSKFGLTVLLEPYRVEGKRTTLGRGFCHPRYEHADTIVIAKDIVQWYHWNSINATYYNDTIANQGLDPAKYATLADPFNHLAFGGTVRGAGLATVNDLSLSSGGKTLTTVDVAVALLTLKVASGEEWISEMAKVTPYVPPLNGSTPAVQDAPEHPTSWDVIWDRSYAEVTAADASEAALAQQITSHVNWDRYLALIQGRVAFAPIKFNGQAFNCNNTGKGWDARDWGADYW